MANWKLQYRTTGSTYLDVVVGPDPATVAPLTVLQAKKQFLGVAERLNSLETGSPALQVLKRELSDLAGYEYVGVSTTNTPTTVKAKLTLIAGAASIEDSPTSPIRTSPFGTQPMVARSVGLEEDRGNVTLTNGVVSAVSERKEWRVALS
jgi:hypothetical protein